MPKKIPKWPYQCALPAAMGYRFHCSVISPTLGVVHLLNFCHFVTCEMVTCGFYLHFLDENFPQPKRLSVLGFWIISWSSSVQCLFWIFSHFLFGHSSFKKFWLKETFISTRYKAFIGLFQKSSARLKLFLFFYWVFRWTKFLISREWYLSIFLLRSVIFVFC